MAACGRCQFTIQIFSILPTSWLPLINGRTESGLKNCGKNGCVMTSFVAPSSVRTPTQRNTSRFAACWTSKVKTRDLSDIERQGLMSSMPLLLDLPCLTGLLSDPSRVCVSQRSSLDCSRGIEALLMLMTNGRRSSSKIRRK